MLIPLIVAALATAPMAAAQDTVVPVEPGTRLHVENHRGEVVVSTWNRDAVRVRAIDLGDRQRLSVSRSGSVLRVRPDGSRGPQDAELEIAVPAWMDIRVEGNQLDVGIRGAEGEISVETVGGDVVVEGGAGLVSVRTIQGEVGVRGAVGRIEAVSVNEDVTLTDVGGDLYVETTNGDITVSAARSTSVRATTVNGDIDYAGTIRDSGRYVFATHNGDMSITVPPETNAMVTVSTYHGEFESDFPVRLTGATRDRQFNFTLGSGSARLELESFNGEIRLRRP
jgi:Putative adhesin